MPVRIARYEPSATAEEKRELLEMLDSLGSNASGIFSRAVELQIVEANRGTLGPPWQMRRPLIGLRLPPLFRSVPQPAH